MNSALGKTSLIVGLISVILTIIGGIFRLISPFNTILQIGFWLGIVAIIIGVIILVIRDISKGLGLGGIGLGILAVSIYWLIQVI